MKTQVIMQVKGVWDGMCHNYNNFCEPNERCYCREESEREFTFTNEDIDKAWQSMEMKNRMTKGSPIEVVISFHNLVHELISLSKFDRR